MWIFLDNDIIHFLLGVWYTRCISASRSAVCDEAQEMTQHTETSAHRAVHRTSTKAHVDINKQNQFAPGVSGATISLRSGGDFPS